MNEKPLVGFGKIPAASSALALESTMQAAMVLFGNALPGVTPADATPPGHFANSFGSVVSEGTTALMVVLLGSAVGNRTLPFASGYMLANGTFTLNRPP